MSRCRRHAWRSLLLMALLATLSACTLLPEGSPASIHLLPAAEQPRADGPTLPTTLRIETPHAPTLLTGTRILVMPEPHRLQAYEGARWSDRTPLLLRDRFIEGFRQRGRLAATLDDNSPLAADVALVTDLRVFHSEYIAGEPVAVIRLDASLVDERDRRLLATRRFEAQAASTGTAVTRVVEAFGRAGDSLTAELIDWTHDTLGNR
ncbi:ABC-type transport auxiliary lipoprotein family protein [Halomonas sp. BM-2019]|uniref:ABC-type transport auxiliary lipoprotein family protein n=1 Tax=Halomonas sp. BM-2019 TaxID=2811227 RepID=UPI001B3C451E|nr:MAG: membrane integrity-associated transporter subunit PqiC [Halomonas sp. BM-2019]